MEPRRRKRNCPLVLPDGALSYVHVLAKPTEPIRNRDCEHRFFLSKGQPNPGDRFRIGEDLLEVHIRQVIESQSAPKNHFITTPDGEPGLNSLCAGNKKYLSHGSGLMGVMTTVVPQGRFATVMDESDRTPRNEPCPCASGPKSKQRFQAMNRL